MLSCWELELIQTHPPRTVGVIVMDRTITYTHAPICTTCTHTNPKTWTCLNQAIVRSFVFPVNLFNSTDSDLRWGQFRCNPFLPQGSECLQWYLCRRSFTAIFYFVLLFLFPPFFFIMKHLWSCLSGLSSQFSPTRQKYEWLICMWTGAFTSVLIETVVTCCYVAWFSLFT